MKNPGLRSVVSGCVLLFCVGFVCLLPATSALLAKLGVSWVATPDQVSLFLTIFLILSAASFVWSYRAHRKLTPCVVGLAGLSLVYVGHEIVPNLALFYGGIVVLVGASASLPPARIDSSWLAITWKRPSLPASTPALQKWRGNSLGCG